MQGVLELLSRMSLSGWMRTRIRLSDCRAGAAAEGMTAMVGQGRGGGGEKEKDRTRETEYSCTGSITPFWVKQKVAFILTRVKIMIRFHDKQNPNKRQTIG